MAAMGRTHRTTRRSAKSHAPFFMKLFASLIILTVLRLVMIGRMELSPDEAYYHEWSQRLDWWYFSNWN